MLVNFNHEVFYEVAKQLSFSKAAEILFISQPAVSKHIKSIEAYYGLSLFERKGNSIELTLEGKKLFLYVEKIRETKRELEFEFSLLADNAQAKGSLIIGASTTLALYVMPKLLSAFHQEYPLFKLQLVNRNSSNVLKALLDHEIDLGIIEGKKKITSATYKFFLKDEVVAVCSSKSKLSKIKEITLKDLKKIPVALREKGSGTLASIEVALSKNKMKISDLNLQIVLGGTEALKNFLLNDTCMGFLPLLSVQKEILSGDLIRLNIPQLKINREFYIVQRQGSANDKLNHLFIKFSFLQYNKKL